MYTKDSLLDELENNVLELSADQLNVLTTCDNCVSIIKEIIYYLRNSGDETKLNYLNKMIVIYLSSVTNDYTNCYDFIVLADYSIWTHIFDTFDDDKLHSIILIFYLCISNISIRVENIIKVYKIMFSDRRMSDFLTETEIFYNENVNNYGNAYKSIFGLLMNDISSSENYYDNYDTRVQKTCDLFHILLKNKTVKPTFLKWFVRLINNSKNFKNNFIFLEDYDSGILNPSYFKLVTHILINFWNEAKKKINKNTFDKIDMEYLKKTNCLIEWEDRDISTNSNTKFMNDIFFMLVRIQNIFFNNLEGMIVEYKKYIDDARKELRNIQMTGLNETLKDILINKIQDSQIIMDKLNNIYYDTKLTTNLKLFQKDIADIINLNIKNNIKVYDGILETNIDLLNSLKIFDDSYFNYNYTNFENSVILFNYQHLQNPFIKHKYCVYSSYYIVDNTGRNMCDLRYKYIENNLLPNIIYFYIALEDLGEDENFYEKTYARSNIINFINFICLKEPYIYASQLTKYTKSCDKKYIRFVNLYINDLSLFFDETFTLIRNINEIEKDEIFISLNNKENIYDTRPDHLNLFRKYKTVQSYLTTLKFMLAFLVILSKYSKDTIMSEELGVKFCSQINYYLNEITCEKKRNNYKIKNKYDVGFQPLTLLEFLSRIILNLVKDTNLVKYMAKDIRSFKKDNIIFTIRKLWSTHLLSQSEYNIMKKFGTEVEIQMEKEEEEIEVPDEFCDPLMASEINDPVILPGTDIIMERSVISRHLLTDLHNPFNRDDLTMEKLEEYNLKENIREIIQDFNERKLEWKQSNIIM